MALLRSRVRSLSLFTKSTPVPSPPPPTPAPPPESPEQRDLVIVGGGPAGLTLAAALASKPSIANTHSITLLEAFSLNQSREWTPQPHRWSNRASSITADNIRFLTQAGIWQHVDQTRTRPIEEMQVWDGLSDARIDFSAPLSSSTSSSASASSTSTSWDEAYLSALRPPRSSMSTMIENINLQRAALRRIDELKQAGARVEIVEGSKVSVKEGEGAWPVVKLEGQEGKQIRARLLIGADGYNSPVKSYSEIETFGWAYDRHGVVASMEIEAPPPGREGEGMRTAWQRFLPEGPVAFLPLSDTHASLVWSTTPAIASLLKALPNSVLPVLINAAFTLPYPQLSSFLSSLPPPPPPSSSTSSSSSASSLYDAPTLTSHVQSLLETHSRSTYDPSHPPPALPPSITSISPTSLASFPLRLSHVSSYLGLPTENGEDRRTVLVGDAAHTVHPLAGQGLNAGLGDCEVLSEVLEGRAGEGGDLGAYLSLLPYPRSRYLENHSILSTCDHLHQLYSSTNPLVVSTRSAGLSVINQLDFVKGFFMGRAGGGGQRGSGGGGRLHGGAWEYLADGIEGAQRIKGLVGLVAGLAVQAVATRAKEFVVRGK